MLKTIKNIWNMSENTHKSLLISLLCSFIRNAIGITNILAILYTMKVLSGELAYKNAIIWVIVFSVVCIIANFIISYIENITTMKCGFNMIKDKRIALGEKLKKMPLGLIEDSNLSNITSTLTTTMSNMESASAMVMIGIISGTFNAFCMFIFMMIYEYRIGLISLLGMLIYLGIVCLQMKISRKNAVNLQNSQNELVDATVSFLQGIKVTKSYSYQQGDERLNNAIKDSEVENIKLTDLSIPTQFLSTLTIQVFESIILAVSLSLFLNSKDITLTKAILLMIFSFMVFASLNQAGSMLSMIGLLDSGLNEIAKIDCSSELVIEEPNYNPGGNGIDIENLSFSYEDNEILHNINMRFKEKTMTAIVGPSGSGKTTLCKLIPRFYDINSGAIRIGNTNIKNIKYEDLMKKISMVFQDVYLFEDTILNNIKIGKNKASMEEIENACEKAQCLEFIKAMPDGFNTIITEGGNNLSGGEKQRISIARAILKDAPIIILDEATASIDPENEYLLTKAINELTKDKTVIVIAHKLETIKDADYIYVINNGEIVEEGTHEKLVNRKGIYRDFVEIRSRAKDFRLSNK